MISVVTRATSLITVPTLLLFGVEPRTAVATNMLALTWLSAGATVPFLRNGNIDRTRLPALLTLTLVSSGLGALLLFVVAAETLPLFIAVMMIVIAGFVILNPRAGVEVGSVPTSNGIAGGYIATFVLGIYGGFFSGGYVTMLTAAWVALFRMPFRLAVGTTKLINTASCLVAVVVFAFGGVIDWSLGIYLSVVMFLGGMIGARLALLMNDVWLRRVFLCAVLLLATKTLASEFPLMPLFRSLVSFSWREPSDVGPH